MIHPIVTISLLPSYRLGRVGVRPTQPKHELGLSPIFLIGGASLLRNRQAYHPGVSPIRFACHALKGKINHCRPLQLPPPHEVGDSAWPALSRGGRASHHPILAPFLRFPL